MDVLWGESQESVIIDARSKANKHGARPRDVAEYATLLESRLDKLALICRALWSFLKDATQLTEEELLERVKEIDLSDGQIDGKVQLHAVDCPGCGRTMSAKHARCLWCGAENPRTTAFDQV